MRYDYDLICIGLGPAGMAVSIMGSEMGLKVCAIESHKIGGECMNVGCIPSKALLQAAKTRAAFSKLSSFGMTAAGVPTVQNPFALIRKDLQYINEKKTFAMFEKVDLILGQGKAAFVDPHTVSVGDRRISAQRIFICVGTKAQVPPFPGIEEVAFLTNENIFDLDQVPPSLLIIGGGAIACEMAQAFARLGSQVTVAYRGQRLLRQGDPEASALLAEVFASEGIRVLFNCAPAAFKAEGSQVVMTPVAGEAIAAERVLLALGRRMDLKALALEKAGVAYSAKGIQVDDFLRSSQKHIFAVGDCNGYYQFSHAAMHQGMLALMNSMLPWPFRRRFRRYVVPGTIFTEPQISQVGRPAAALEKDGVRFETVKANYGDYGAAIAEKLEAGFVKALIGPTGRIYGATVVGEGSADMINEWGLAIQNRIRIDKILFLQHSFPSMAFLNKRVAEGWMMNRMRGSALLRRLCQLMFRR